ncbi:hypothetical protein OH781_40815 [Streptomyces sp. NBC_01550]|uniref:CATRA system-associated protein n=1 Tax=Streptomyces sp. NBC_01550 TaxID=2975875 RepID=UPI00386F13DD
MTIELRDALDEAAEALAQVMQWRVTARAWTVVDGLVAALAEAVHSRQPMTIEERTARLQERSPARVVTSIDDPLLVDPPAPVRERVNELVHAITSATPEAADAAEDLDVR